MPVEGIVGIVVAALIIAGFVGFALRDDSDVDMKDVSDAGRKAGDAFNGDKPERK